MRCKKRLSENDQAYFIFPWEPDNDKGNEMRIDPAEVNERSVGKLCQECWQIANEIN